MKQILVIGGSHGISQSLVKQLRESGNRVFSASRTGEGEDHQKFDALEPENLEIPDTLDGLVYAPGSITLKPSGQLKSEEMMAEFQLNALSAALVFQKAVPTLKKSPHAAALFFSTVAVQTGMPYHVSIAMAKGAVEGLVRSLAAEFAPKIRVNALAPSLTDTPLAESFLGSETRRKAAEDRHPLKAIADPEDVASLAAWLLSDAAKFVTGQIINIDGGLGGVRTF